MPTLCPTTSTEIIMNFCKYHGCGNDFVITDYKARVDYSALAKKLCDRKTGIGADGLIAVKLKPLEMVFYNMDGSRAPMCGNGIRCFARYCYEKSIVKEKNFDVLTLAGVMKIQIVDDKEFLIKVNMGEPLFDNDSIKAADGQNFFGREIIANGQKVKIYSFFMGTIHTVVFVDNISDGTTDLGAAICNHELFCEKTNVNFGQVQDGKNFVVRTYERGVGWTCACGTGACASYVTGKKLGICDGLVNVHLQYGTLKIEEENENIFMTGPACLVFEGKTEV